MSSSTLVTAPHPSLRVFSRPFSRFGILPIGGRSTAARLSDGSVWVLASTPLDEPTKTAIAELGEVRYLVAPDNVHHLYIKEFADAYPSAKVVGVEGLDAKQPEVKWTGLYGKDAPETKYGFEGDVEPRYFSTFANKDVAFCHKESKTMITADLLFNLPPNEQYKNTPAQRPTSWLPFAGYLSKNMVPASGLHQRFLWMAGAAEGEGNAQARRAQFAADAAAVAKWDFERIIMCHGDIIEGAKAKKAWTDACARYIDADGKPKV